MKFLSISIVCASTLLNTPYAAASETSVHRFAQKKDFAAKADTYDWCMTHTKMSAAQCESQYSAESIGAEIKVNEEMKLPAPKYAVSELLTKLPNCNLDPRSKAMLPPECPAIHREYEARIIACGQLAMKEKDRKQKNSACKKIEAYRVKDLEANYLSFEKHHFIRLKGDFDDCTYSKADRSKSLCPTFNEKIVFKHNERVDPPTLDFTPENAAVGAHKVD